VSAIGPGDFVEIIRLAAPGRGVGISGRLGQVLRVRGCGVWSVNGQAWLTFTDMPDPPAPYPGWDATSFRPIYRPDQSLISDLLQPVKEPA
jgi:hypothetical protein